MRIGFCVLMLLLSISTFSSHAGEVLSNQAVVEMVQLHLADEVVVRKIETSICQFDTGPQALAQLQAVGVSSKVIGAMLSAGSSVTTSSAPAVASSYQQTAAPRAPEFSIVQGNGYRALAAAHVSMENSHRKSWIPIYGRYAGNETFFFIKGVHAGTTTPPRPVFMTTLEPSRLRLVHLGVHDDEDRYVVFSKGRSDREIAVTAEVTNSGSYRLTPTQPLEPGEYAWLTSSAQPNAQNAMAVAIAAQVGGLWTSAYDFTVQ